MLLLTNNHRVALNMDLFRNQHPHAGLASRIPISNRLPTSCRITYKKQATIIITHGMLLKEALYSRNGVLLCILMIVFMIIQTSFFLCLQPLLVHKGIEAQMAANMYVLVGGAALISSPICGQLNDMFSTRWVFCTGFILLSITLITSIYSHSLLTIVALSILWGISNTLLMITFYYALPYYFGLTSLGAIQGALQIILVISSAVGAFPLKLSYYIEKNGTFS